MQLSTLLWLVLANAYINFDHVLFYLNIYLFFQIQTRDTNVVYRLSIVLKIGVEGCSHTRNVVTQCE